MPETGHCSAFSQRRVCCKTTNKKKHISADDEMHIYLFHLLPILSIYGAPVPV